MITWPRNRKLALVSRSSGAIARRLPRTLSPEDWDRPRMTLARLVLSTILGSSCLLPPQALASQPAEPQLQALFPLGARAGSSLRVEVRGKALGGVASAWFDRDGLRGEILKVESLEVPQGGEDSAPPEEADREYRVLLQLTVEPECRLGPQPLRLVSARGISNLLYFQVHDDPVIAETELAHHQPSQAQHLPVPAVVNGRIGRQGELDYYSFDVEKDQELAFEVILSREGLQKGFRPQLRLEAPGGSWFDSQQTTYLAFHTEIFEGGTPLNSGLSLWFDRKGRYLLQVGSERFKGGWDHSYQLRIVPVGPASAYLHRLTDPHWKDRIFARSLGTNRLNLLWSRTVGTQAFAYTSTRREALLGERPGGIDRLEEALPQRPSPAPMRLVVAPEREPNNATAEATDIVLPALVEGTIEKPGDVDYFRMRLESDQHLAFELQTLEIRPPYFNPRLEIRDASGRVTINNIQRMESLGDSGSWDLKAIEPKIIETFEQSGDYILQVRDATARAGGPKYRYRLLVREQIPHVGEVTIETLRRGFEDVRIDPYRINLRQGMATTLYVTTRIEEIDARVTEGGGERDFGNGAGELVLLVEGLPQGVQALMGTAIENKRTPRDFTFKRYSFLPDIQKITIFLQAESHAPLTPTPHRMQIFAQPLIQGRPGARLLVAEMPLMVVQDATDPESQLRQSAGSLAK